MKKRNYFSEGRYVNIKNYEVIIVGAGPAGSTAAKFIAEDGIKVLLIDKCTFPRDKPCGGGIAMETLKRFPYIDNDLIETYTYGSYIHSASLNYKVHIEKKEPLAAFVLRKKFDHKLIQLAIDSGASFLDGKKVIDFQKNTENASILLDDGMRISSQLIIGADGVWSIIAKKSGLKLQNQSVGLCIVQEIPMSNKVIDEYFTEKRIGHLHVKIFGLAGYGWVFPKHEHINIGIGQITSIKTHIKDKKNLRDIYNQYIMLLKNKHYIPSTIDSKEIKGAALPTSPLKKTYTDRIILCGDAAGLINPFTGDGIKYAMISGQIASEVCKKALDANNTSEAFLSCYQRRWQQDFGKDIKILLRAQIGWTTDTEKVIKFIANDDKLAEICFEIAAGNISIQKSRLKLMRRFFISYMRNLIAKK